MLQRNMDIDKAEAVQYITKVDEDRQRWTKFLYGEDWSDPAHFDVVINLRTMSLETACKTIAFLTKTPEFRRTDERIQDLRDKALAARVYAALKAEPKTREVEVDLAASGSVVSISGRVTQGSMRKQIVESIWDHCHLVYLLSQFVNSSQCIFYVRCVQAHQPQEWLERRVHGLE